jgi:hypothetical protein
VVYRRCWTACPRDDHLRHTSVNSRRCRVFLPLIWKKGWAEAKKGLQFSVNFLRTDASIEDESLLSGPMIILAIAVVGAVRRYEIDPEEESQLLNWVLAANARGHFSRGSTETILDQDLNIIFRKGSISDPSNQLMQQLGRIHVEPDDFVGREGKPEDSQQSTGGISA